MNVSNSLFTCYGNQKFPKKIANQSKHLISSTWPTKPEESFFFFFVSEGHTLCHVVCMLTQKEGQVLAIRSLGLMWPGHGHGSSESPVEP